MAGFHDARRSSELEIQPFVKEFPILIIVARAAPDVQFHGHTVLES